MPLFPHPAVFRFLLPVLACALPLACSAPAPKTTAPPLFEDLGDWHRSVSTRSKEAQRWFDQGLRLTFGFNHDEAIRSYEEAARVDPSCAMAWWGIAYAHGPHINNPAMTEERRVAAWDAVQKAVAASANARPAVSCSGTSARCRPTASSTCTSRRRSRRRRSMLSDLLLFPVTGPLRGVE